jgi:hypothetical protein
MIVERNTYPVKMGAEQGADDLVKNLMELVGPWEAYRIYIPSIGPSEVVATETEYKDSEQPQEWWANLRGRPEMPEWVKEWHQLRKPGSSQEIWELAE